MSKSKTLLVYHFVFTTKYRKELITEELRQLVEIQLIKKAEQQGHKILAVYCMPDHCHLLISGNPAVSVSDTAKGVKGASTYYLNRNAFSKNNFAWQGGYFALTVSPNVVARVVRYIRNQPVHHQVKPLKKELSQFVFYDDE